MLKKIFSTVIFSCALFSCGKYDRINDGGFTKVTFQKEHSDFHTNSTMTGGIMIYAYSNDFSTNIKLNDETSFANIVLPNGPYSFYAFGYTVPMGNAADPGIRCAVVGAGNTFALTGGSQTVNINLTQAACNTGAFTGDGAFADSTSGTSGTIFRKIETVHCGSAAGTNLSTIAVNTTCSGTLWSNVSRFRVHFPLFVRNSASGVGVGSGMRSACVDGTADNAGLASSNMQHRVPLGSTSLPFLFPLEIETYSETACTSTPIGLHKFHKGLIFGPHPDASYLGTALASTSGTEKTRIFLREP